MNLSIEKVDKWSGTIVIGCDGREYTLTGFSIPDFGQVGVVDTSYSMPSFTVYIVPDEWSGGSAMYRTCQIDLNGNLDDGIINYAIAHDRVPFDEGVFVRIS